MKKMSLLILGLFLGSFMTAPAIAERVGTANVSGIVKGPIPFTWGVSKA